jgi:hypothetical protein
LCLGFDGLAFVPLSLLETVPPFLGFDGLAFWFRESHSYRLWPGTDLGTLADEGVIPSGDKKYSPDDGANDSFCGFVYAYGVDVRSVNTGGSFISVFICGIFPLSAKLFLLRSLAP